MEAKIASQAENYEAQLKAQKKQYETQLAEQKTTYEQKLKELQEKAHSINNSDKQNTELQSNKNDKIKILDEDDMTNIQKIELIGKGGGGKVFKVSVKSIYALKEMNIDQFNIDSFKHFMGEYELMSMLHHPNILQTFGIFMSNETTPPSILLEYCSTNLEKEIKKGSLSKDIIVFYVYQIIEGMRYVHFKKIIHRDLKPTNILITEDGMIKICDFGISKLMTVEEQTMTRGVGTQRFMAPEVIDDNDYNEKVDVYSFGVLLYFVLSNGQLPKIKLSAILSKKKAEIPSQFTEYAKQLISACWNFDPKDRPSFQVILETLEKSNYNLFQLKKSEIKNIKSYVMQHKSKIPQFPNKLEKTASSKLPSLYSKKKK